MINIIEFLKNNTKYLLISILKLINIKKLANNFNFSKTKIDLKTIKRKTAIGVHFSHFPLKKHCN